MRKLIVALVFAILLPMFSLPSVQPAVASTSGCTLNAHTYSNYNGVSYGAQLICSRAQTGQIIVQLVQGNVIVAKFSIYGTWDIKTTSSYKYCTRQSVGYAYHVTAWFVSEGQWLYGRTSYATYKFWCR